MCCALCMRRGFFVSIGVSVKLGEVQPVLCHINPLLQWLVLKQVPFMSASGIRVPVNNHMSQRLFIKYQERANIKVPRSNK
jgi:hypothetical protein